jgi:amino acid adenylation domain-containing protein
MMEVSAFLTTLRKNNIQIWVEGSALRYRCLSGTISNDIKEQLVVNKEKLIIFLQGGEIKLASRGQNVHQSLCQEGIYQSSQFARFKNAYNIVNAYEIPVSINAKILREAIHQLIQRHESLRTNFSMENGNCIQIIHSAGRTEFSEEDHSRLKDFTNKHLKLRYQSELDYVFDLQHDPLFRVTLLKYPEKMVLIFNLHHIITDAWSNNILLNDLLSIYGTLQRGNSYSLPTLKIQYADFAVWQRSCLSSERYERLKEYWKNTLEGVNYISPLHSLKQVTSDGSTHIGRYSLFVDRKKANAIKQLSKALHVSHSSIMFGAFSLLVSKFGRSRDFLIGFPVSGRHHPDTHSIIGSFINILPIRLQVEEADTFEVFVQRVAASLVEAHRHQDMPIHSIIQELNPSRQVNVPPLIQILFNALPLKSTLANELGVKQIEFDETSMAYDLMLNFEEDDENGFTVNFLYNQELFDQFFIKMFCNSYECLLQEINDKSQDLIQSLSITDAVEKENILNYNRTEVPYENLTLHQLFERQVEIYADKIALVSDTDALTFNELNHRVNKVAHFLINYRDVRRGDRVALILDRGFDMIVSVLAVLKVGCAYVPIEPSYPESRREMMLTDADPKVIITGDDKSMVDAAHSSRVVNITSVDQFQECSNANPWVECSPYDLAYVMYTSGSTGRPKGVMVAHTGIVNRLEWMWRHYKFDETSVFLQKTTYAFDISVWEIFTPLCFGARLVLCSQSDVYDPKKISEKIIRHEVNAIHFVPSMYSLFLSQVEPSLKQNAFSKIRFVYCSAEALTPTLVKEHYKNTHVPLVNLYGPTEASIEASYYETLPTDSDSIPVGRPISNAQLFILDESANLLPRGVVGEIVIGGVGVAKGYLNLPDLTAKKFVTNAFGHGKLYRTGDLGLMKQDGNIEFLGRIDDQVKVRGYRIELDEIKQWMEKFEGVRNVAVMVSTNSANEPELIGYFTSDSEIANRDMRAYLLTCLPSYSVPTEFVRLEELPLNGSGKIDRQALLKHKVQRNRIELATELTPTEATLKTIWEALLSNIVIQKNDHFFEVGGHSLKAAHLIARIVDSFQVQLTMEDIYKCPMLSDMANLIDSSKKISTNNVKALLPQDDYELSHAQQRLWFFHQSHLGENVYNIPLAVEFEGKLNDDIASRSVNHVIDRHEILRTIFIEKMGEPRQRIIDPKAYSIKIVHQNIGGSDAEVTNFLAQRSLDTRFHLDQWPLFCIDLLYTERNTSILFFVLHHIISDGWSLKVLLSEFAHCYNKFAEGKNPSLANLKFQYKDFAAWHNSKILKDSMSQRKFWLDQFDILPEPLVLPFEKRTAAGTNPFHVIQLPRLLSTDDYLKLNHFSIDSGISIFSILLSCTWLVLYKLSGNKDIILGVAESGRQVAASDDQIGFYVNTVPVRIQETISTKSFVELAGNVNAIFLKAISNCLYPYDLLFREVSNLHKSQLFDVMVVFQNFNVEESATIADFNWNIKNVHHASCNFKILLEFVVLKKGFLLNVVYQDNFFDKTGMENFAESLVMVIEQCSRNFHFPVSVVMNNSFAATDAEERNFLESMRQIN